MPSSETTPSRTAAPPSETRAPQRSRNARRALLALSLAAALVLAGCGGSAADEEVGGTTEVTTGEAVDATSPPVESENTTAPAPSTTQPAPTSTLPPTTLPPTTLTLPENRPVPVEAMALAAAITDAELAIRDPALDDPTAASWGRHLQRLYRTLADNEAWATEVLEAVDPAVAEDVAANWSARQHLSALVNSTRLAEDLPAWRINEPLPPNELLAAYRAAEEATGVPWELLASINFIETRMGRIEGLSTAGAVGPMQFLPSTWEGCCEGDPTVDADAIMGAAVYLTLVGAPDDIDGALFSYNRSTDYVEAVKDYASVMERNELAYRGYHAYDVFFRSAPGLVVLRPGYEEPVPVDAATWIANNPDALISD